jgi:hypothetical protein
MIEYSKGLPFHNFRYDILKDFILKGLAPVATFFAHAAISLNPLIKPLFHD